MSSLIHIVGEDHPEDLFIWAINRVDENLPTEDRLNELRSSDLISALSSYQKVMDKYFYRTEEDGKKYLNGSKEIKFGENEEEIFWKELLEVIHGVYSLNPQIIEGAMKKLKTSKEISSRKKQLIIEMHPDTVYHEGIKTKGGKDLEYGLHSIVPVTTNSIGSKLVYLDEDFKPYTDTSLNHWSSQEGRELHWAKRIMTNPPRKIGLLFVGDDHLMGIRPGIPYIGEFLDLLREKNINYSILERSRKLKYE